MSEIEFVSTSHGVAVLGDLISDANKFVLLVTPYVQLSEHLFERLAAARRAVPVHLVCRADDLPSAEADRLLQLGVVIRDSPNLHAKCYASEKELLLTSMNLYLHSQSHNWEMGVRVRSSHPVYASAMKEIDRLLKAASAIQRLGPSSATRQLKQNAAAKPPAKSSPPTPRRAAS